MRKQYYKINIPFKNKHPNTFWQSLQHTRFHAYFDHIQYIFTYVHIQHECLRYIHCISFFDHWTFFVNNCYQDYIYIYIYITLHMLIPGFSYMLIKTEKKHTSTCCDGLYMLTKLTMGIANFRVSCYIAPQKLLLSCCIHCSKDMLIKGYV